MSNRKYLECKCGEAVQCGDAAVRVECCMCNMRVSDKVVLPEVEKPKVFKRKGRA